jgi:hypothetical protein
MRSTPAIVGLGAEPLGNPAADVPPLHRLALLVGPLLQGLGRSSSGSLRSVGRLGDPSPAASHASRRALDSSTTASNDRSRLTSRRARPRSRAAWAIARVRICRSQAACFWGVFPRNGSPAWYACSSVSCTMAEESGSGAHRRWAVCRPRHPGSGMRRKTSASSSAACERRSRSLSSLDP